MQDGNMNKYQLNKFMRFLHFFLHRLNTQILRCATPTSCGKSTYSNKIYTLRLRFNYIIVNSFV